MRRLLLGTGAAVALLIGGCGDDGRDGDGEPAPAPTSTTAATTTTSAPGLPEVQDILEAGAQAIRATPFADWVTVAGGSAWVANVEDGVGRYDLATGELLGSAPTGTEVCLAMEQGFGSLWVGDCATTSVVRVDLSTGEVVATIALPVDGIAAESSIGVDESGVWVLSTGSTPDLVHIDPATDQVVGSLPAPSGATAVRAGDGSLWITAAPNDQLVRLDPTTGDEQAVIDVAPDSIFLAIGEGGIWTLSSETGEVTRVDPATDEEVARIPTSERGVSGGDIAVGGGYVWARVSDTLVAQIDPATDTVVARYGPPSGSGSVAADDDAVWVSAHDVNTVWRLPIE